jgi:hypothetical protein
MASKVVENKIVQVAVGSVIENAVGRTVALLPSDWDMAAFRYPNPIPEWETKHAIALNVQITGRTFQYRQGRYWIKVRLIWVGDCEPDTESEGWLLADPWKCQRAS